MMPNLFWPSYVWQNSAPLCTPLWVLMNILWIQVGMEKTLRILGKEPFLRRAFDVNLPVNPFNSLLNRTETPIGLHGRIWIPMQLTDAEGWKNVDNGHDWT